MKYINKMGVIVTAGLLAVTSCSDFDDYNNVPVDSNPIAGKTLWENISENESLTQFAELAEKGGLKNYLGSSRFFTVWAPVNGSFDYDYLMTLDSVSLRKQFIENHVAEYRHVASGDLTGDNAERVTMLNRKKFNLTGMGTSYSFGEVTMKESNLPALNGLLHTLNGKNPYMPSMRELMGMLENADSIKNYYNYFYRSYLDEKNSVKGPVDTLGRQTYLDSVMIETNDMEGFLKANFADEDSSFTILIPTDKAYQEAYQRISPIYNYIPAMVYQDLSLAKSNSASELNKAKQDVTMPTRPYAYEPARWGDSLTRREITQYLVFSNNNPRNEGLSTGQFAATDTLIATTQGYTLSLNNYQTYKGWLSNPEKMLESKVGERQLSNGYAYFIDSLAYQPGETFNTMLIFDPRSRKARILSGVEETKTVKVPRTEKAPKMLTNYRYSYVKQQDEFSEPELDVYLPGVKSMTYDFYVTMIPADIDREDTVAVAIPNSLKFELSYCTEKGELAIWRFSSDGAVNPTEKAQKPFVNDTSKVDRMYIGTFKFPVSYYGLGNKYAPNMKIKNSFYADDFEIEDKEYTLDLRIGEIILVPHYDMINATNEED